MKPIIPKGWREMKPNELVLEGDRYFHCQNMFLPSGNYIGDRKQDSACRPYIRRIAKKGGKRK